MHSKSTINARQGDAPAQQQELALQAARKGLDFFVRHQEKCPHNANYGRFPYVYRCQENDITVQTTNWVTAVLVKAMLLGHQVFGDAAYLESAERGVAYLRSLQDFNPFNPRLTGAFHEDVPQSDLFHPRDALTAAWALLEWSEATGCEESLLRARAYASWFTTHGMNGGFPRWTVSFHEFDYAPHWYGSFHSGGAFFFARLYNLTNEVSYLQTMRQILDHYNSLHLTEEGDIHVIVDIAKRSPVADADAVYNGDKRIPDGWIRMHEYNDDFGALANLEAWRLTEDERYLDAARRFLARMQRIQRADGGFGPEDYSIPSAGGAVLIELMAARALGTGLATDVAIEQAIRYVLGLQVDAPGSPADGGFNGYNGEYRLDPNTCNARAGGYAVMSLLRYAGATGPIYFPQID